MTENRVGARGLFPRASSHTTWRTVLVPRGCEQSSECPPSSLFFCLHTLFPLPTSVDRSVPQSSHSEALPCRLGPCLAHQKRRRPTGDGAFFVIDHPCCCCDGFFARRQRSRPLREREERCERPLFSSSPSPHQSHSYLHDRVRGAQAARCRSFGGLGTVRDVSGRKYFSDAVPAAAPRRLTANGLETSGRGGCRVRLGVKTWRLPSRKTCS